MKKMINTAFGYAIASMAFGVFYREFTKFNGFDARTSLAFGHLHLMVMGCLVFLIVALFAMKSDLLEQKRFRAFYCFYNAGLALTTVMFAVRGIAQVRMMQLSAGMSAAISGIAGLGHITLGIGIVLLFLCLKKMTVKA
ncbi:MAG: DUF2871 domain-containing protein [Clostridia bacterium]